MKKLITFVLFLFSISCSFSQSSLNASGNTFVIGSSSISYTLGQIDFANYSNSTIVIYLGVQQPQSGTPKFITLEGVKPEHNLVFTAYPNPTFDNIKIRLSSSEIIYNYFLFDTSGKLIKEGNFKDNESIIPLENFPTATYFLKVISENGFEKNIKIIKNEK
jgi:hypothetical protein